MDESGIRESNYYITGSKDEFLSWLPEVGRLLFDHFNVKEISLKCHDKQGDESVFVYRKGQRACSPEYTTILKNAERKGKEKL